MKGTIILNFVSSSILVGNNSLLQLNELKSFTSFSSPLRTRRFQKVRIMKVVEIGFLA